MPSSPLQNPRQWRFTWETLAHIPTLRLYLFNREINPSARCHNLSTHLRPDNSLLLVRWDDDEASGGKVQLRVPVPKVLIDPSRPLDYLVKHDHIEIKLCLILPMDHPLVADLLGVLNPAANPSDRFLPLSLGSDMNSLSSGDVDFYCKACSTKLTIQPLRRFVEMPSVNWQEMADNWFGTCCCSFGGVSEKLVSQYIKTYDCSKGTCLLDGASVILCKEDLEGYTFENLDQAQYAIGADILKLNLNHRSGKLEMPLSEALDELSLNEQGHCCANRANSELNHAHGKSELAASTTRKKVQQSTVNSEPERSQKWLHNSSLGSGFIISNSNLSNDVEWIEFSCRECSSPLGSYPSLKNMNVPLDGGVRLFKCYISTCIPTCGARDIFRKHTLDTVFVNSLLETAEDELSFRTIVRDLSTKSAMLQVVLLNSKAWSSNGYSSENAAMESFSETDLQPIVKLLFSDCSTATEADARIIKEWSTKTHVEEVYMMSRQIEELTSHLKVALERLPFSCSSLQGMCLSSLER